MTLVIKLFISILGLIFITVPWFYTTEPNPADKGFTNWFIYSLLLTVIFSIFICYAIGRFWDQLADENAMGPDLNKKA